MKKILIVRRGLLGDTLVAIPALRLIKKSFPDSYIHYVSDQHIGKSFASPQSVLFDLNLVDSFSRWVFSHSFVFRITSLLRLIIKLRKDNFDLAILLERNNRGVWYIRGNKFFLSLCGVKHIVTDSMETSRTRNESGKLIRLNHEADYLLELLYRNNINTDSYFDPLTEIQIVPNNDVEKKVDLWIDGKGISGMRLVAVAPNTNMSVKKWPIERYIECINFLVNNHNIMPVFIGSASEVDITKPLIDSTKSVSAMGVFSIHETVSLLRRCLFYLGNDTGAHHLAAAAGITCVVIFSSRDNPGKWHPYGKSHKILRTDISCEGCMLHECNKIPTCVQQITVQNVVEVCEEVIKEKLNDPFRILTIAPSGGFIKPPASGGR